MPSTHSSSSVKDVIGLFFGNSSMRYCDHSSANKPQPPAPSDTAMQVSDEKKESSFATWSFHFAMLTPLFIYIISFD